MTLKIQPDYWSGTECLNNEVPWQTPESIYRLDEICSSQDTVLEVGTGGSTLFYARRCKSVIGIETSPEWHGAVVGRLQEKNIENVTSFLRPTQREAEELLKTISGCSVLSIDSVFGYDRSRFLNIALECNKGVRVLVLDNYADQGVFPAHYDKTIADIIALCPPGKWSGVDYDDSHWCGRGTRILIRAEA